ncbi:beta-1,4-galactosyltransferase 4 [Bombina bombina]|uniref:beta-1,4-galactosyltransferase 4 n=1 Tax=Bombina bombina TaxID=8345 RepID=UPI00235AA7B2|nr:beta-1,4-galactosyltransferase 4 [Bombina bombina]XP_053561825.1 beta-1,4-galactosyltransferase 4 [Bombina bombina]
MGAVKNLICKTRILLLIAVCVMIVGWIGYLYNGDEERFMSKPETRLHNFWKYSSTEKDPTLFALEASKKDSDMKTCPALSPYLQGAVPPSFEATLTFEEIKRKYPSVVHGRFHPETCRAQQRVAILIPHRNREKHLLYLLDHLHPFLQRQQLDYGIYLIHQAGNAKFNRAKLLNVGYMEALKEEKWDCFIFHDVDLVPENDFNLYLCDSEPKHLVVGRNVTGYRLLYKGYFGGVTALTTDQVAKVNGYSNNYWGWGGEDDDLRVRVTLQNMKVVRPSPDVAKYTMIFHTRDSGNEVNKKRMELLRKVSKVWKTDGLNSCVYKLLSLEHNPLYINITVDIGGPDS